jgi:large subunit ribosomal protein L25
MPATLQKPQFTAAPAQYKTKGELKRLRHEGFIPVSVQHKGQETLHFLEETRPLEEFIRHHGEAALVELAVESEHAIHTVYVHDVQRDPITHHLLQVTFQKVEGNESIKVHVPVVATGTPEVVLEHLGVMDFPTEALEVRGLPGNIPEHITIDVSGLDMNHSLRVSDIPKSDQYDILTHPDTVLATVSRIKAEVEEATASEAVEAAEEAEPEEL